MPPKKPVTLTDDLRAKLYAIYKDPENRGSYGGAKRLFEAARAAGIEVTRAQVNLYLQSNPTYTRYHVQRLHFPRRRVLSFAINHLWELDLAFMLDFWHENGGTRYLMCQIDVLSKKAHVVPIPNKEGGTVAAAIAKVFDEEGKVPRFVCSDLGTEFTGQECKDLMKQRGVTQYFMLNPEVGAPHVERFIRTLKARLYRYMDLNKTKKYVDVLPKIVDAYNRSWHSSIEMAPADVRREHEEIIRERLHGGDNEEYNRLRFEFKYALYQLVRTYIERTDKNKFLRGFQQQFSDEIYAICSRLPTLPPSYKLCPLKIAADGVPEPMQMVEVAGSYYEAEIVPITVPDYPPPPPKQPVPPPLPPPFPPPPLTMPGDPNLEAEALSDWGEEEEEEKKAKPPPKTTRKRAYLPRATKKPRN